MLPILKTFNGNLVVDTFLGFFKDSHQTMLWLSLTLQQKGQFEFELKEKPTRK
jgi:hypothetical protein